MNYSNIYSQLVLRGKKRGNIKKALPYYTESHHIIPRCLGGGNETSNLVLLTAREHFIAHRLLSKMYPLNSGLKTAVLLMAKVSGTRVTARVYGRLREEASVLRIAATGLDTSMPEFVWGLRVPPSVLMKSRIIGKKLTQAKREALRSIMVNAIYAKVNNTGIVYSKAASTNASIRYSRSYRCKDFKSISTRTLLLMLSLLISMGYIINVDAPSSVSVRERMRSHFYASDSLLELFSESTIEQCITNFEEHQRDGCFIMQDGVKTKERKVI